ncbi:hypothetical protein [Arthrobacter sp. MYb213]|uniref:hypothetical protein n=1 Tax=Arthrobacter sp. MYb213 TaxID=1848595 RepID=UPI000CFABF80|nr:hypothetical protein [Arthrobacter sp. MYb213]PRB67592.1 hypothetical protein CQ011_16075 [Arthrobacter sp. MYb213]
MTSNFSLVRWVLAGLGALCVALVIAALISVAMRPTAPLLPPNTAEGVIQRYVMAIADGDIAEAKDYVANTAVTQLCDVYTSESQDLNVDLLSTVITGNQAVVTVNFVDNPGAFDSIFGIGSYPETFELRKSADEWKIQTAPWQVNLCTDKEMIGY